MTTELGRLVNNLIEAAQAYSKTKGYIGSFDALNAQVAAEKALLEYVEKQEQRLREGVKEIVGCMDADHESSSYWAEKLRALLK